MDESVEWNRNVSSNATEGPVDLRTDRPALAIYGLLALFWFCYLFLLYKICRCHIKNHRIRQEAAEMQAKMKLEAARINALCLARQQLQQQSQQEQQPVPVATAEQPAKLAVIPEIKVEFVDPPPVSAAASPQVYYV